MAWVRGGRLGQSGGRVGPVGCACLTDAAETHALPRNLQQMSPLRGLGGSQTCPVLWAAVAVRGGDGGVECGPSAACPPTYSFVSGRTGSARTASTFTHRVIDLSSITRSASQDELLDALVDDMGRSQEAEPAEWDGGGEEGGTGAGAGADDAGEADEKRCAPGRLPLQPRGRRSPRRRAACVRTARSWLACCRRRSARTSGSWSGCRLSRRPAGAGATQVRVALPPLPSPRVQQPD